METETLLYEETALTTCPAFIWAYTPEGDADPKVCGKPLKVILTTEVVGDDIGSWTNHYVSFDCGHTLLDMQSSVRQREYI